MNCTNQYGGIGNTRYPFAMFPERNTELVYAMVYANNYVKMARLLRSYRCLHTVRPHSPSIRFPKRSPLGKALHNLFSCVWSNLQRLEDSIKILCNHSFNINITFET